MTAYAAWNSPEEAKIIDMFNSHQVKKRSKKKRMKERKLYTKNLQNSTVNRSIVGELYESIIDSKLPYEFRFTTHKLNEPLVHNKYCPVDATVQAGTGSGEKRFIDVTSYSTSEETLSTYVITENKDGNISIHLDPDRKSYQSQRNDSIYCCIGMPYYEQSLPMSETDERRKDHNVRRKIEDDESGYNQVESATLTKSLYDAKESLLFKLRLKKTVTSLPRGVNGYFYELDPIPSSKAHTNGPDEIVKKMKRKKIIRKEKFNKNNGCCRFTFYNNPNEDQTIFRESSADVPFAYGGVEGQSKTWDIVGLMDTDVDTGIDEEFNLHGRLKENWYDCMCRYSGFPILI